MLNIFATYFCGLALSEVNVRLFALRWAIGLLTVGNSLQNLDMLSFNPFNLGKEHYLVFTFIGGAGTL